MSASTSVVSIDSRQVEQLDLFAEAEAAAMQARLENAPTLFDTDQCGYFARLAAFDQWARDYGHFASFRRSHAWHAQFGCFGGEEEPTDACRP